MIIADSYLRSLKIFFILLHMFIANPNSGEWSSWGDCSAQCGGGSRFRVRMCRRNDCVTEEESCNTQDCEPEPELQGKITINMYVQ